MTVPILLLTEKWTEKFTWLIAKNIKEQTNNSQF